MKKKDYKFNLIEYLAAKIIIDSYWKKKQLEKEKQENLE